MRRPPLILVLALVAVLGVLPAVASPEPAGWPDPSADEAVPGAVLVTAVDAAASTALAEQLLALPETRAVQWLGGAVLHVRTAPGAEAAFTRAALRLPAVAAAEPDWLARRHAVPDDPWFARQWSHQQTGVPAAWDRTIGSRTVRAAVIDTGMRGDHPDLLPNIEQQVDFSTGTLAGAPQRGIDNDTCNAGHGSWVGGVLGAAGANTRDVAGVAWQVSLVDIAVNSTRTGARCDTIPFSAIIAGIDYALANSLGPVDVVNLSVGAFLSACPTSMQSAVNRALAADAVVVASAGNGELDPATAGQLSYPASCQGVISVAATGRTEARAAYSTTNARVDLAAPGGDYRVGGAEGLVLTTHEAYELDSLRSVQGTSFSAPYVAGVVVLMRTVNPAIPPAEVRAALTGTARDLDPAGRDNEFGHGLVQPAAAVAAAMPAPAPAPVPTPIPEPEPIAPPPAPAPVPTPTPSPTPTPTQTATPPRVRPSVQRVGPSSGSTTPVNQSIAVSQAAFADGSARMAVLARDDEFADALAASALGMGEGPVLFTRPQAPLDDATRSELRRVLPRGARVYLIGGTSALTSGVEADVRGMGYEPVRLAGASREATAAVVAGEVRRRAPAGQGGRPNAVILATRSNWPDAVSAGQLAAAFAVPVLLTHRDQLSPSTQSALRELRPKTVYVVGGTAAVSDATARAAGSASGGELRRLGGSARDVTAVRVAEETLALLDQAGDEAPRWALAVNLRTSRGYAYALAASMLAGKPSGVFVPVERNDGSLLTQPAEALVRARLGCDRIVGALSGGRDVLTDQLGQRLEALLVEGWQAGRCG